MGWWTFEEGEGRYAFDVTDQRYQSKIAGRGTKWVTADDLGSPPPTPAWRERACCKVEIRRAKLAKAGRQQVSVRSFTKRRALEGRPSLNHPPSSQLAPCDCPYGCGAPLLKKDVKFHTTFICPEIVEEPPDWLHGEKRRKRAELAEKGLKQQEERSCPAGCDMIIKAKDLQKHLKEECDYRMARCRNPGCGAFVPMIRLQAHEQFFCESEYAVAKKEMVKKAREKYGYPTPWRLWDNSLKKEAEDKKRVAEEMKEAFVGRDAVVIDIGEGGDEMGEMEGVVEEGKELVVNEIEGDGGGGDV